MATNIIEPLEETEEQARTRRQQTAWAKACMEGERTGIPALTDCERRVLAELRALNYTVAAENQYGRYIRKAAA